MTIMHTFSIGLCASLGLALAAAAPAAQAENQTLLLRQPDLSADHVAFVYAGDIWVADRDGGHPRRLTADPAGESVVKFSPDGSKLAFSANFDNNTDVYVIAVSGGQPKRLTYHPGPDLVSGWSADGSAVMFASRRENKFGRSFQRYTIGLDGGLPVKQMQARFFNGAWSPDGANLAYIDGIPAYNALYGGSSGWRQYRGGASPSIAIMDRNARKITQIPGDRINDLNPMWVGGKVWFISDRDNIALNLFSYDPVSKAIVQHTHSAPWDVRWAGTDGASIVYEAGGRLFMLDTATDAAREIKVSIAPDLPQVRTQWKTLSKQVESFALSPSAKRALLTARGEVFTVPLKDGSTRNLTRSDGVREFGALWSPRGDQIAWIDDAGGAYHLVLRDQRAEKAPRRLALGPKGAHTFYSLLNWGGDGRHIIYQDNHLNLFAMELSSGKRTRIATNARRAGYSVAQSPDGAWLAYTLEQPNFLADLMLYNFASGRSTRVSDDMSDTGSPVFSRDGKYLYFTASTNSGPAQVGLNMSSQERPYRAGIYALVLRADGVSPLLPKTGDEEAKKDDGKASAKDDKATPEKDKPVVTKIDLDGLGGRIVALPLAERNYDSLQVSAKGALYFVERVQPGVSREPRGKNPQAADALKRFDFKDKKATVLTHDIEAYDISADGSALIWRTTSRAIKTAKTGDKFKAEPLKTGDVRALINPRHEWRQIFEEAWRMERDFFYAPNMHGLDWQGIHDRYAPLLAYVGRREDLSALLREMIGEMQVGHNRTGGGDVYHGKAAKTGLLGADLRIENGHYRIKTIFTGEHWNPFLQAPLAAPGLGVHEGDYILALNGIPLTPKDNIFARLEGARGSQLSLLISTSGARKDAREVIVEPVGSERQLRHWAWLEGNRKWVDEHSGGRVGYVYLPNTAGAGYAYFNRMMFAQSNREAMIFDERSNGGGQAANYIIDVLRRKYLSSWKDRDGMIYNTPGGAVYGPKVMMIDQDAGSGGDYMPYAFRYAGLGKLVGKRTWGGLIGIYANPPLIDGGFLTVPFFRFFTPEGKWDIENKGVAPDIRVDLDPLAWNKGRDTQLERTLGEVMEELKTYTPIVRKSAPPFPQKPGQ